MAIISNNPFLVKVPLEAKTWLELMQLQLEMNRINNNFQFHFGEIKRDSKGYYLDVIIDIRKHKLPNVDIENLPTLDEVMK